jgi:hypothetical protein
MDVEAEYLDIVFADLVADVFAVVSGELVVFQGQALAVSDCTGIG